MHIVCLGDSITYGDGLPAHKNWVSLMATKAMQRDIDLCIDNAGINGETALDGLRRLPGLLSPKAPDVLYVQFGLNDAWQGQTVQRYIQYMQQIVRYAKDRKCGRIYVAANHTVCVTAEQEEYGGKEYRQQVRSFNAALRSAFNAADSGAVLIDIEAACDALSLEDQALLLQPDGVHISAAGYRFYCDLLESLLIG